tara:strand:- start:168 stop:1772 length:1605 start_codon:yes stop_codon:yes gene_type:complete
MASVADTIRRDEVWRRHILSVSWPVAVTIGLQVVELLLLPIPSEVSPLDQTLSGGQRRPHRALAILLSAAPAVLAFGTPCAAVLCRRLPLRLSHHPPSSTRGAALGMLLAACTLSIASVLVLRKHLYAIRTGAASATPCAQLPFSVVRHPISLSILLLAIALTWLLPSLSGLVGSAWLALHLDRQLRAEEAVLTAQFGEKWTVYAAGVPRWADPFSVTGLLVSSVACGWMVRQISRIADSARRGRQQEAPQQREDECIDAAPRLPAGLCLVFFAASQVQRAVYLQANSLGAARIVACGAPEDLRAALLLGGGCCVLGRWAPCRLACALALALLGVDLFLRLNAGVRLTLDLIAFGVSTLASSLSETSLLLANLSMAAPGTLLAACAALPLAALLVCAAGLRVRSTRPRLGAVALAAAVAAFMPSPCCGPSQQHLSEQISCGVNRPGVCCGLKIRAQAPNVLGHLAHELWERNGDGGDGAALAHLAIELQRNEMHVDAQCAAAEARGSGSGSTSSSQPRRRRMTGVQTPDGGREL